MRSRRAARSSTTLDYLAGQKYLSRKKIYAWCLMDLEIARTQNNAVDEMIMMPL